MAVMTTLAIIAGVTLLIGGAATAGAYYATEDDRARARIKEIEQEIKNCNTIIDSFNNLKSKLQNGKYYLNESKTDFTNGGHVLDGVPLANSEFNSCIDKLNNAINNVNNIIKRYNDDKNELKKEKRELQAKLN